MEFEHLNFLIDSMFMPDESGAILQKYHEIRPETLQPLVLAYIGDAYFHLFVRGKLLVYEQNKVQVLHQFSAKIVSAVWQAKAYYGIEPLLTEAEKSTFKRGRNAKSHVPKSASVAEYRASTGFEALLGMLYLTKQQERLYELAEKSFEIIAQAMMEARHNKRKGC